MQILEPLISAVNSTLEKSAELIDPLADLPAQIEAMAGQAEQLQQIMLGLGDHCREQLSSTQEPGKILPCYIVHFLWADRAKSFLILWRDVLFQQQKAGVLAHDGGIGKEELRKLAVRSQEVVAAAARELAQLLTEETSRLSSRYRDGRRQMARWKLQKNPWPVYREQMSLLGNQCRQLREENRQLFSILAGLQDIRRLIEQILQDSEQTLEEALALARSTIEYLTKNLEPGKVADRLEDMEKEVKTYPTLKSYAENLEQKVDGLPEKMRVTIATERGILQYKEITFRKSVRSWLESEILPILYEVGDLRESAGSGLKMSLVNIRNRALLLAAELKEGKTADFNPTDISQPLTAFLKNEMAATEVLHDLRDTILRRLDGDFNLVAIYDPARAFLPLPLQSSLNQLRINQWALIENARRWVNKQLLLVQQFKLTVEREENLSTSEKVVRLIRHRQGDPANTNYTSIFLTKGYIGESFWVGRSNELRHAKSLIDNWRSGFRGAVMITGQRLSGKSLFGDIVAQRYFPDHTIRLMPNSVLNLGGRRMTTGYDLGEALEFIKKHTVADRYLVWIDDLELWGDPTIPLSRNVRRLRKYIDNYSNRLFFLVAMSNWLRAHLDRIDEIDKVFQAEINVSRMAETDIREAILIRHGATHKTLVDEKGREVTPAAFHKMIRRIHRAAEGNVGEALNRWSYSTHRFDDDRVAHQYRPGYTLPDNLVNQHNGLLLSAVMLSKRTNEYRLRKQFGPAFSDKYGGLLQRLISTGLLTRQWDDWLEVNELTANDVGRQLERKNFIQFHR